MLRVLGRKTSGNVQKVIWLLEEMGEAYKREDYGRQFNNTQDAAYLALNPNGKVPTIVDGDTTVWESNTILRYLANRRPTPLYPPDPAVRSQIERWMDWQLASLNNPYLAIFRDAKKPEAERGATWAKDAEELGQQLQILDGALKAGSWLAGGAITLADICLGPIIHRCLDFPIQLPALSNLRAWRDKLKEKASFKKATAG